MIERRVESELMETVKEEKEETNEEQDNTVEERKIMQLATIETAQQRVTAKTKTNESDTPVEENEEAILPEDGILLTYVEKQSCTNEETETIKVRTTLKVKVPERDADNWSQAPRDGYETSEKSQKS